MLDGLNAEAPGRFPCTNYLAVDEKIVVAASERKRKEQICRSLVQLPNPRGSPAGFCEDPVESVGTATCATFEPYRDSPQVSIATSGRGIRLSLGWP